MAGIISNVDSDVQKLRKLKNEIENVKKALMGINIKVDIDIAKGLQSQLTSLLGQYDVLVDKIAAAEAKIMLSTSRINKATEKIVQAQEQVSKPAGIPTQSGNTSTQTNTAETASIQAQAKAYDDLRTEINGILGTREENVKRMIDEMNAIRLINVEIKKINKSQGDYSSLSSAQQKRLEQLNNSLLTHKEALAEIRQTLNNNVKLDNVASTSMKGLSQSLSRMRIAYRELTEEERNSPFGKELLTSINQADAKIKELDATIGNHQRNVGNYGKQWNGLSMSIQQVGRELPSLAYGPKVFFSAISNNLPILADEIKRARIEYDLLKKSGQSATPVWKQVASSLFSWQTALTVGITLLTLYGDKVVDWVAGLFNAKNVMKPLVDIQQQLNDVQLKGVQNAQSEITKLELLYKATQNASKPIRERKKAVDELQKSYPDFFKNLSEEEILTGKAADAYARLTSSIIASARARAAQDKMTENAKKILENEAKITEEYAKRENAQLKLDKQIELRNKIDREANPDMYAGQQMMVGAALGKVEEIDEGIAKLRREIYELNKSQNELAQNIDVNDLIFNPNEDSSKIGEKERKRRQEEAENRLKQQEQLAEQLLSLRRKNQQDEISLMADGTEKKLAQIDLDYQKELDAIESAREKAKKDGTYEQQSALLDEAEENAFKRYRQAVKETHKQEAEAQNEAMNRYLKEYGTFQQKKEAITKEYNDKMTKATTEGDKKLLQKEMEEALSSVDMDKLKQEINWELIFGDLNKVSKKSLEQVKQQLKAFKNSDEYKNMAVDQKKVIDEALNNIQSAIIDKGGLLGDLPEQLDALRIAQDELKQAQDEYNKSLKSGTDAEKEAALKKKNNAEKNVQNAEANVTRSADKTKQNLITLADTITQLGSSSEISLSQIGNIASGLVDAFSEAGSKIGGIIGAVFSLLDGIEKQGFDGFVENIFSSVFRTAASIWDTITFGAFSKITGSGDSDKTLERDIEYLTQSNQDLKNSLDNLSEKMDKASVTDASDIYEVQRENILKQEANTLEAMQRSAAAYSNGFLGMGGSHSSNNKIDKGISASEWSRVSDIVGKSVSNAGQFFQLSSEQMSKLAEEDTSLYSKIKNLADDGYKNAAQYMDEYITYYKQLEELENAYNEKLTNTSFDNVRNDFKNVLLDMESDAEDFANDFEKMMQNAIVESLMTKKYDKLIQDWYGEFAEAMKSGGKIDEIEQGNLQNRWNSIVNQALAERDALKEMMGWESESDSTREVSQKGIATASQDSVDENNGRLAVMQGHTYSINENVNRMATGIDTIAAHTVNLSCLTSIDKTMQSILSMRDASLTHLSNIDSHTARLEAIENAIVFMKNDINTMLIKGLKLSKN